jgi:hypothetical protein
MLHLLVAISLWNVIKQYCHLVCLLQRLHNSHLHDKVTDGKCNIYITSAGNIFRPRMERAMSPNYQQTNLTSWHSRGTAPVFREKRSSASMVLRKLDAGLQRPRFNLKGIVATRKVFVQVFQFFPANHIWECSNKRPSFTSVLQLTTLVIKHLPLLWPCRRKLLWNVFNFNY